MTSIGAYEAKTNFSRLLVDVEAGETITITRHGREVAKLIPVKMTSADPARTIADLKSARAGVRRGRTSVRGMIDDGRR